MFLFTGTGRRRAEPVSRNRGTGAFGTRAVYRRLGLRLWKWDLHWKQRIQNEHVHYCIATPRMDRTEQSPAEEKKKICYIGNQSLSDELHQEQLFSTCFRFAYELQICAGNPQSAFHRLQDRWLTLISSHYHFVRTVTMILFCHLLQPVSSIKNPHLPLFPHSIHSQKLILTSRYSLSSSTSFEGYCTNKKSTHPSHPHTFTYLLVDVSGYVGLPLV